MNNPRIEILKSYIQKEPDNPFNKYALAMEYYESEPIVSLEVLLQIINDHPDYLPSYYKAAHLYWDAEELDKSSGLFESGIKLAKTQKDDKALKELNSAHQNLLFEMD